MEQTTKVAKYRKLPVEIEAIQFVRDNSFRGTNLLTLVHWIEDNGGECIKHPPNNIGIKTLEGTVWAEPGWWIVQGIKGEFYPVREDIFEATYEPVEG